ncbi:phycobiliprotein lyase [Phormidesmis priestleyi]|nr:phycobiliprotein lyase [Phormidesmis priestleyi]
MEFFQLSAGKWLSQRTTHHLAFKRSEGGESEIAVEALSVDDPKILEICKLHDVDPSLAVGGAQVQWMGTMAWDRSSEENHEGSTVFVLVPDEDNPRNGRLLREVGYAEIVPVIGRYEMDDEDGLVLITEYETMSSKEHFWFASPDVRIRSGTVKRFGGFSTASFCTETRIREEAQSDRSDSQPVKDVTDSRAFSSNFGW